jgi:integrase
LPFPVVIATLLPIHFPSFDAEVVGRSGMKGFMRQRGNGWELRVYLGRDPVSGQRRYASKTVRGGKREAESALAAMVADAQRGASLRTNETVGALLERWFEHAAPDFSPTTVLETRGILDRYLLPAFSDTKLNRLGTDAIDRFYRELRASGGKGGRALSPATIRRIHGILRRAMSQGVRWGWLGVNPAAAASPPKVLAPDIKPPTPADIGRVFAAAEETDPDLAAFLVLAAATGARRSELLELRWIDVEMAAGVLTIGRALVLGVDGLVEKDTKTHAIRRVSIDPRTTDVLAAHRHRVLERAAACAVAVSPSAYVFSHAITGEEPWHPDSTSRAFRRICDRLGLEGVRLHDLRHYVATRLLAGGVDVRTVAGRLGHRNASTTLNVYSHFLPEADRDAANLLARLLDPTGPADTE